MKKFEFLKVEELPDVCYGLNAMTNEVILIKKNVSAYYETEYGHVENIEEFINDLNEKIGVTYDQRKTMEMRSIFANWNN